MAFSISLDNGGLKQMTSDFKIPNGTVTMTWSTVIVNGSLQAFDPLTVTVLLLSSTDTLVTFRSKQILNFFPSVTSLKYFILIFF